MSLSPETAWKSTLGELELQMTRATFNTWLKGTRVVDSEEGEFVIGVRNDFAKDWLENRLQDTVLRTLSGIVGRPVEVRFIVCSDDYQTENKRTNGRHIEPPIHHNNGNGQTKKPALKVLDSPQNMPGLTPLPELTLSQRFTFANFVVGSNNRLAHAAALSVSENPGKTYNPLFIYSSVGLGKTHLLHAIGHRCHEDGCRVLYISAETFANDLIMSIRNKQTEWMRERYRTVDVLLIDDIQFIAGKESTQEEFFHTFNELHSHGKQVVITSDRPPKALVTLEERLQSRFEWGLMADIQAPDIEMRKAILQSKAEEQNYRVPDYVFDIIAHHVRDSIRELEGALNKVIAFSQFSDTPITEELVDMALADLLRRTDRPSLERVVEVICYYYGVSLADLASASRKRSIAYPRQVAMYMARNETDASLPQVGTYLGGRDHTTIMYGCDKIARDVEINSSTRREVLEIKARLYESGRQSADGR